MEFVCLGFKVINGNFHYNNVLEFVEIVYQQIKKRVEKLEITNQMMDAINGN
ncbi:unnamed protein product [Paramecium primaurelia]|uniref:Uncharacterized protein n=1 Tax=Paramecium primaurelia TaxID=5886 RepID=A0A8S1K5E4_PARPR|nr:unnamed protein product [Paramecium primaurelia]CAD8045594.1 unnamed protein product [Paramecium primaurelia]